MNVTIIISSFDHPMYPYLMTWVNENNSSHNIEVMKEKSKITSMAYQSMSWQEKRGDFLFLISCSQIIEEQLLNAYTHSLVLHASDLPRGRGWSPHIWDVLNNKSDLTLCLLEASRQVDSGDIWKKVRIPLSGHELFDEINHLLFTEETKLLDFALQNFRNIKPIKQIEDDATHNRKRDPDDSELDINRSIIEQFNLLRISDRERFPPFFIYEDHKYQLEIKKIEKDATIDSKKDPDDSELDINRSIIEQFNLLRISDRERYPLFFMYLDHKYQLDIKKLNKHDKIRLVKMPQIGVNDDEAQLIQWHIADGDKVKLGDIISTLETTKAAFDTEADASGYLIHLAEENQTIKVNEPFALITPDLKEGEKYKLKLQKEISEASGSIKATKKALTLAKENNINIEDILLKDGSIIRESDVLALVNKDQRDENIDLNIDLNIDKNSPLIAVAIYGAGKGGNTMKESLEKTENYMPICFLDDNEELISSAELPVFDVRKIQEIFNQGATSLGIAVIPGSLRRKIYKQFKDIGFEFINIIHPHAYISPSVEIGIGNHIKSGAIIETNTKIGNFCIIDNLVAIAHDNLIGDGCHLAPGVSLGSNIRISENTVVGIGASISTGISIGRNCIISVGSAVINDVEDHAVIDGVPGKIIGHTK